MYSICYICDKLNKKYKKNKADKLVNEANTEEIEMNDLEYEIKVYYRQVNKLSNKAERFYTKAHKNKQEHDELMITKENLLNDIKLKRAQQDYFNLLITNIDKEIFDSTEDIAKELYNQRNGYINKFVQLEEDIKSLQEKKKDIDEDIMLTNAIYKHYSNRANDIYQHVHELYNLATNHNNKIITLMKDIRNKYHEASNLYVEADEPMTKNIPLLLTNLFGIL